MNPRVSEQSRVSMRRALDGVGVGVLVGIVVMMSGGSQLWWLAVPIAGVGAGFLSRNNSGSSGSESSGMSGGSDSSSGGGDGGGGGGDGG